MSTEVHLRQIHRSLDLNRPLRRRIEYLLLPAAIRLRPRFRVVFDHQRGDFLRFLLF